MEDLLHFGGIKIPISENANGGEKERVIFYPDELPEDHQVLGDVLKGVLAPFKVWRTCAVSFKLTVICEDMVYAGKHTCILLYSWNIIDKD